MSTLAKKTVNLSLWHLSWPIFIEIFLQMLMGTVDQVMVGHHSLAAVAALANANQIVNIFIVLLTLLSAATTILIAQYLGANNRGKIEEVFTTSILVNGTISLFVTLLLWFGDTWFYAWIDVPPSLLPDASHYLRIVSICIICQGLYFSLVASFRAFSLMKITMIMAGLMNVVHILLNYVFLYGYGGSHLLGVAGVGWSNNITRIFGLLALFIIFVRQTNIRFAIHTLKPFPWHTVNNLLYIGVPSGGESFMYQLAQTTIMRMVNVFGVTVITTKAYVSIVAMGAYLYSIALAAATQVIVGYLLGAKRDDEVSPKVWRAVGLSVLICGTLSTCFYFASNYIFGYFTSDPNVIALGKQVLLVEIILEIGRGVNLVMVQSLQAAGDVIFPVIIGIGSMWSVGVGMAYVLGVYLDWGLVGIWAGIACDEILRALIFITRWQLGYWKNKQIITT